MITLKNNIQESSVKLLLVTASLLSISVFLLRLYFSLDYEVLTSGCEEESLYAVWKYVYNLDLYQPNSKFPFTSSYFNANFYFFYGEICKFFILHLKINHSSLPIITRLISVAFTLGILMITYKLFRINNSKNESAFIAIILVLNPYLGFWSITCRPDIGATFFSIWALYNFQKFNYKINYTVILLLVLAWSFKQSFIFTALYIFLFHGIKNINFIKIVIFTLLIVSTIATSIYFYGNNYIDSIFLGQKNQGLDFHAGLKNLLLFFIKASPLIIITVVLKTWKNYSLLLSTIFILTFILTCKDGASDNYYLEFYFIIIAIISTNKKGQLEPYNFYLIPQIFILLALLLGIKGNLKPEKFIDHELTSLFNGRGEKSAVLNHPALNLPWIIHGPIENIYHVKSFTYDIDFSKSKFDYGGIYGTLNNNIYKRIFLKRADSAELKRIPRKYSLTAETKDFFLFEITNK
jgi:hypothetical protein